MAFLLNKAQSLALRFLVPKQKKVTRLALLSVFILKEEC